MTLYPTGHEVRGFHPGNDGQTENAADYILDDVREISVNQRITKYKDKGNIIVNNTGGQYSNLIRSGDRLVFRLGTDVEGTGYGEGGYGVGPYGGSAGSVEWTALVRQYEITGEGVDNYTLDIEAEDFAAGIMGMRNVHATFEDRQISGSNGILNEILGEECPEVDTSQLPDLSATTTIYLRGQTVLPVAAELARRADKLLTTKSSGAEFGIVDLIDPPSTDPQFTVQRGSDVGTFSMQANDDNLVNNLRVEGGEGRDVEEQSQQTTVNGYETVSESARATYQIQTRKPSLERIAIWTRPTGSNEDYEIRLQKDDGGAPIAIDDEKSDIVSHQLDYRFVSDDDFTEFILPDHTLPEPFPWLIIQTNGSTGQDIGIDTGSGNPGVIPEYPYNIVLDRVSRESIERYRRRDGKLSNDAIGSFEAAREGGDTSLAQSDDINRTVKLEAYTDRMHALQTGEVVALDHPPAEAVGDYVVMEKEDTYTLGRLDTSLTLREVATI